MVSSVNLLCCTVFLLQDFKAASLRSPEDATIYHALGVYHHRSLPSHTQYRQHLIPTQGHVILPKHLYFQG